jgi:dihydroflavonol-4-reductase
MKAFVTGSTGLLGSNLVRLLVTQGHQVKVLARSKQKATQVLEDLDVKVIQGDMLRVQDFASELEGCDVLFHTAAYFREYYQPGNHGQLLEDINIKGTIQLLEEAEKRGVKKAVYVSSSGVIGMKPGGLPGDETTPPPTVAEDNLYFKSKILAESAVHQFVQEHHLPVVLILPGWMWGPQDAAPTANGRLVLDFLQRKIPVILDGGNCVVDARDVAQAMVQAAVQDMPSGERYIVGGDYYSLEELMRSLAKITGISGPKQHLPYSISLIYAWFAETYARLTNGSTLLSLEGLRTMHAKSRVDSSKAVRELGVTFRPLENTLQDEVSWFQTHGYS